MKNDYKHRTWRAAFATQTNNNSLLLEKYDYYVATHHDAQKTFECLAGGSDEVLSASQKIARSLEEANQNKIDCDPLLRLRKYVDSFNTNLDKCGIEIVGMPETNLAEHQIAAIAESREQAKRMKLKLPKVLSSPAPVRSHTAYANHNGGQVKMEVEW